MTVDRRRAEKAGRRAETLVSIYLRLTGHRILARRFKTRSGEIDIVARRGRTLIFVEVKQRARADQAVDPVTARSEERIIRAGEVFLARHPGYVKGEFSLRYDVIIVTGNWNIRHQKDMFRGW